MKKDKMFDHLVKNAFDFLFKAICELEDYPKYSVIHFYAGLELFVKARLMAEHWTLAVAKRQEPDLERFISGDFQSVSLDDAATRLSKVVRSGLSKQELEAFRAVAKHRNKMVHFFHEAHTAKENDQVRQRIVKQQLIAWHFLNRLLTVQWKAVFESWSKQIAQIDTALRQLHGFLQVVFENLTPEIEKLKSQGTQFGRCPSCGFQSQGYEAKTGSVYEAECLVCKLAKWRMQIVCPECSNEVVFEEEGYSLCDSCGQRFQPEDVADVLQDGDAAHRAARHGDDSWDLGNCSDCEGYHTVVRIENDEYFCAQLL